MGFVGVIHHEEFLSRTEDCMMSRTCIAAVTMKHRVFAVSFVWSQRAVGNSNTHCILLTAKIVAAISKIVFAFVGGMEIEV